MQNSSGWWAHCDQRPQSQCRYQDTLSTQYVFTMLYSLKEKDLHQEEYDTDSCFYLHLVRFSPIPQHKP